MDRAGTITGISHVTLVVSDLDRSVAFYSDVLGAVQVTTSAASAYLELGTLWLCLERGSTVTPRVDDSHIALSCSKADFASLAERIRAHAPLWKDNTSHGASVYFLDPDGHRLELHSGSLAERLDHYRAHPDKGVRLLK